MDFVFFYLLTFSFFLIICRKLSLNSSCFSKDSEFVGEVETRGEESAVCSTLLIVIIRPDHTHLVVFGLSLVSLSPIK